MRGELLLDTGALVSLLDRSQTHHLKCRRAFADWTGSVVSTEAVLTEATSWLAFRVDAPPASISSCPGRASRSFEHDVTAACPEAARQVCRCADGLRGCHACRAGRGARLHVRVHDGSDGFFSLQTQRPEALSYPAERLSRPERSLASEGHETVARRVSDVKVFGTRPVARHSRTVSWAIRTRRCERVSPGPLPSR